VPRDTNKSYFSEYSTGADLFDFLEIWLVTALLERLQHDARLLGGSEHGVYIGDREAEGFLTHDVFARFKRLQRVSGVELVRRSNNN
jgi:hypothetical protein